MILSDSKDEDDKNVTADEFQDIETAASDNSGQIYAMIGSESHCYSYEIFLH